MDTLHCTLYRVHCTVYSVECEQLNVYFRLLEAILCSLWTPMNHVPRLVKNVIVSCPLIGQEVYRILSPWLVKKSIASCPPIGPELHRILSPDWLGTWLYPVPELVENSIVSCLPID